MHKAEIAIRVKEKKKEKNLRRVQISRKIDNNILVPNFFEPKRTWLTHLLSFASLFISSYEF